VLRLSHPNSVIFLNAEAKSVCHASWSLVCVGVCVCVCVRARARVRVCVCVCV
jgi:hypothetical protein